MRLPRVDHIPNDMGRIPKAITVQQWVCALAFWYDNRCSRWLFLKMDLTTLVVLLDGANETTPQAGSLSLPSAVKGPVAQSAVTAATSSPTSLLNVLPRTLALTCDRHNLRYFFARSPSSLVEPSSSRPSTRSLSYVFGHYVRGRSIMAESGNYWRTKREERTNVRWDTFSQNLRDFQKFQHDRSTRMVDVRAEQAQIESVLQILFQRPTSNESEFECTAEI